MIEIPQLCTVAALVIANASVRPCQSAWTFPAESMAVR